MSSSTNLIILIILSFLFLLSLLFVRFTTSLISTNIRNNIATNIDISSNILLRHR